MIGRFIVNYHLNKAQRLLKESVEFDYYRRSCYVEQALKHLNKAIRYDFESKQQVKQQIKALQKELEFDRYYY